MLAACSRQHFLIAFMCCVYSIGLSLISMFFCISESFGISPILGHYPLLPNDLSDELSYGSPWVIILLIITWVMAGLLGIISLCQFVYYNCLPIFSGNVSHHDPRMKDSCTKCTYFFMVISVLPVALMLLIYQIIFCWDVTLIFSCEVDFHYSQIDHAWNKIQYTFECCGQHNYTDWGGQIPGSCCKDLCNACNETNAFKKGCHPFIKEIVRDLIRSKTMPLQFVLVMSLIFIILVFRHMFTFVFQKCFSRQHKNDHETLREDDIEAVPVEEHMENEEDSENDGEDEDDDEQLLEDVVQNIDDDDTELLDT